MKLKRSYIAWAAAIIGVAAFGNAVRGLDGAFVGAMISLFALAIAKMGSTIHKDDKKNHATFLVRGILVKRLYNCLLRYIKMSPNMTKDKEYPFLSRIHHVVSLALADDHRWTVGYSDYVAGNLQSIELFLTELKIEGIFREDILWALIHASQAVLQPFNGKFDPVKAERAVDILEALVF